MYCVDWWCSTLHVVCRRRGRRRIMVVGLHRTRQNKPTPPVLRSTGSGFSFLSLIHLIQCLHHSLRCSQHILGRTANIYQALLSQCSRFIIPTHNKN